jgi:phosphoglycolate phosphatase
MRSERNTYSTFVFDLDGTLVDSRPAIEKAAQRAISAVVPAYRGRCITAAIGPPIRTMFQQAAGELDARTLDQLVAAFRSAYDRETCLETPAYAGAAEMLSNIAAQGAASYVLTNKPRAPTLRILAHLGLDQHLLEILTPDSPTTPFASKAEALRSLMHRHKLGASDVLMVGDSGDDALAASACGVAFAAALYGYGGLHKVADRKNWLIIESPQDILLFLRVQALR